MGNRIVTARAAASILGLAALAVACGDALEVFPLEGQLYDPARDCLGGEGVIDVVEGIAEGTCEGVRCLRAEATGEVFVSPQCEAPVGYVALDPESDEVCAAALAAHERGDDALCPDEG